MSEESSPAPEQPVPNLAAPVEVGGPPIEFGVNTLKIVWANVALDSPEGELLLFAAVSEPDLDTDEWIGKDLPIVAALVREVMVTDKESGEVAKRPATLLLLEDGKTIGFVSKGILESLGALVTVYGKGPWKPALVCTFKQIKMGSGHRKYVLGRPTRSKTKPAKKEGGTNG